MVDVVCFYVGSCSMLFFVFSFLTFVVKVAMIFDSFAQSAFWQTG